PCLPPVHMGSDRHPAPRQVPAPKETASRPILSGYSLSRPALPRSLRSAATAVLFLPPFYRPASPRSALSPPGSPDRLPAPLLSVRSVPSCPALAIPEKDRSSTEALYPHPRLPGSQGQPSRQGIPLPHSGTAGYPRRLPSLLPRS